MGNLETKMNNDEATEAALAVLTARWAPKHFAISGSAEPNEYARSFARAALRVITGQRQDNSK